MNASRDKLANLLRDFLGEGGDPIWFSGDVLAALREVAGENAVREALPTLGTLTATISINNGSPDILHVPAGVAVRIIDMDETDDPSDAVHDNTYEGPHGSINAVEDVEAHAARLAG